MAAKRPVLIVDGDAGLRAILVEQLAVDGEFAVTQAATLAEAQAALATAVPQFDAVILDACLPDGDGWNLRANLRQQGFKMPVIVLTADTGPADASGEVIAKPFRLSELLTRLRGLLRDFDNGDDLVIVIGRFSFHPAAKCLLETGSDTRIRLTEKEVAILRFLHRAGTQPVTRQVLLNEVWGYNAAVTTHTLETHIYRLRKKIEPDPAHARLLLTEGGGYRLNPNGLA